MTNNKKFLTVYGYMIIMHLVYPPPIPPPAAPPPRKKCLTALFPISLRYYSHPKRNQRQWLRQILGVNKVNYCLCENCECSSFLSSHCVKIETKTAVMRLRKKRNACEFVTKTISTWTNGNLREPTCKCQKTCQTFDQPPCLIICSPRLFKSWISLSSGLITIQRITQLFPVIRIRWIVIYPVDSAIQLLNNLGQAILCLIRERDSISKVFNN